MFQDRLMQILKIIEFYDSKTFQIQTFDSKGNQKIRPSN